MRKITFLLFLFVSVNLSAQVIIEGIVYDSTTLEPLPFVNIAVKGTSTGTSTSLNGKFSFQVTQVPCQLIISYVGYTRKEAYIPQKGSYKFYLKNSGINLGEATVFSGPDPALLIMKKVLDNADQNNPEKNGSFSYTSYNKMVFTIGTDSIEWAKKGSTVTDEEEKKTMRLFEKQHLFMSECVSERKFLSAHKNKETVIASRVSGFATPVFNLISTQFQSFHFYTDEVSLGDVKYVGPVSRHGLNHYRYILEDTFFMDKDTVYAISFRPDNENSTQSMKGVLQIHSNGYAVYNVIAEPFTPLETGFGIKINQQYRFIENKQWFPEELNTRLIFYGAKIGETPIVGIGTGILSDIRLNPEFSKKDFDEFEVVVNDDLSSSDEKLKVFRSDSLTNKEKETYRVIDSLGNAHHLDKKMLAMQSLFNGYVPIKFLDWDLTKLMNYNDYEGFRLGLALRTNHKISKYVSLGGYVAYGFGDKAFKVGSDVNVVFSQKKQFEFNVSVRNDVEAASAISYFGLQRYLMSPGYSALFLNRFDSVSRYEARVSIRGFKHFKFHVFANHQQRKSYRDYFFVVPLNEQISYYDDAFTLAEVGGEIKMAIHEKFVETPFGFLSMGTAWPIVSIRYTQGWKGVYGSEYEYRRITARTEYQRSSLRWGTIYCQIQAGMVNGEAPYHLLFNPAGTYKPIKSLTVYSMDGFETMRLNEVLYDRFYSLHFRYRLPKPLVNGKKFRPLISITTSLIDGRLEAATRHQNINYTVMNKPFTESGLLIDNLIKSGVSGIGIGVFYRWGAYQFSDFRQNLALKISLSLSLG